MTPNQIARSAVLLAVLFTAYAAGQVDDRARQLLDGVRPVAGEAVQTLDQTVVMTLYAPDGTEQQVRSRSIIDFEGRRAVIDTEVAAGMNARIVLVEGEAPRMIMGGMTVPVPPAMAQDFTDMFDQDPLDPLAGVTSASYDGRRSYGGMVEGEQVTVRGSAAFPGLEAAEATRLLFDAAGRLIAIAVEVPEVGTMLGVYDVPVEGTWAAGADIATYLLEADGPRLVSTMRFEEIRVNEPLAPGAFD